MLLPTSRCRCVVFFFLLLKRIVSHKWNRPSTKTFGCDSILPTQCIHENIQSYWCKINFCSRYLLSYTMPSQLFSKVHWLFVPIKSSGLYNQHLFCSLVWTKTAQLRSLKCFLTWIPHLHRFCSQYFELVAVQYNWIALLLVWCSG